MNTILRNLGFGAILALAFAACGGDDSSDAGADDAAAEADSPVDVPDETSPDGTDEETAGETTEIEEEDGGGEADAPPPVVGPCGTDSPEALMGCVERARYVTDITALEGPRDPGSEGWQAAQDLCEARFTEQGYTIERHDYGIGINIIGVLPGDDLADERVLVSAHYDGIADCPDADDNASGVAGILETSRVLATGSYRRTLVVACWDQEELGLIGSRAYAARADEDGENILVHFVYEMIGYYSDVPDSQTIPSGLDMLFPAETAALEANENRGDFLAAIGDDLARTSLQAMAYYGSGVDLSVVVLEVPSILKNSPLLLDLQRSDHAGFWRVDIPAMMLTDTSEFRNARYHCGDGDDTVDSLDHDFATKIVQATVGAAAAALELR